jgi:hypothetical protein
MKGLLSILLVSVSLGLISSPAFAAPSECSLKIKDRGVLKKYTGLKNHKALFKTPYGRVMGAWQYPSEKVAILVASL